MILSSDAIDIEQFWKDGFLHIPGFFPVAQVERWRTRAIDRGKTLADLLSDDVLQDLVTDPRVVGLARSILGGDPVYFGDSTAALGYNGWGFHKDNSDRLDAAAPDWATDRYPLIRFGVYCQDHDPDPGGLELRRGSHLIANYTDGEYVTPKIRRGDPLVWNFRTSHSAGVRRIKLLGTRLPHHKWIGRLNQRVNLEPLMRQPSQTRVGLFLTMALRGPLLDRHIEYLKNRSYPWEIWAQSSWDDEARAKAAAVNLDLIDLTTLEYDGRKVHVDYHAIPY